MFTIRWIPLAIIFVAGTLLLSGRKVAEATSYEFVRTVKSETSSARENRHEAIRQRRSRPIILVHRGASAFAPENTLEAYAAAMDYGADGCEVDLRLTRDGVLVLFHDDMLDRLTESFGDISELSFREAMQLKHRLTYGRKLPCHGPPTFVALLEVARQRRMLLHLDIKLPGFENEVARLLDEADAWDHVVAINTATATNLLHHPKLKLLKYRGGLYEKRRDVDSESVRGMVPKPGEMIIVDDPRVAANIMGRRPYSPQPLPDGLFSALQPGEASPVPAWMGTNFNLFAFTQKLGSPNRKAVLEILKRPFPDWSQPASDAAGDRARIERIVERAWAAQSVAGSWKSPELIELLRKQVRQRSLHPNWRYHGLDGSAAVRALVRLGDKESVPLFIDGFSRVDPALNSMPDPFNNPPGWRDAVFKMHLLPALGMLPCPASKEFLFRYLAMDERSSRELMPPQEEEATRALLAQRLSAVEHVSLVRSTNLAVRGTTILEFLDHPTRARTAAIRSGASWALALPSAK